MLLAVFGTVAYLALDEADGMGYDGEDNRQVFSNAFGAAREVNDEGLLVNAGNGP